MSLPVENKKSLTVEKKLSLPVEDKPLPTNSSKVKFKENSEEGYSEDYAED